MAFGAQWNVRAGDMVLDGDVWQLADVVLRGEPRQFIVRVERGHAMPRFMYAVPYKLRDGRVALRVSDEPVTRVGEPT